MKPLHELVNRDEPGWELVERWLAEAENHYEILPRNVHRAERELLLAQVTTRSPMGAVIFETGGILIDHGWIRVLGSGCPQLDRGLMEWNRGKTFEKDGQTPGFLLTADDVVGGYFAINAGGLGGDLGKIHYLAPDSLQWENLECGYSDFLHWLLHGDIAMFYESFKWPAWREDVKALGGNEVFSFVPFLWTKYECIEDLERRPISIEEHYRFTLDVQSQLS